MRFRKLLRWRPWPQPEHDSDEIRRATEETQRELDRVRAQWPLVRQLAQALHEHHERNHFSESIANIYRGGHA